MSLLQLGIAKIPRPELSAKQHGQVLTIDQLVAVLESRAKTLAGIVVTPETCMEAPTVHAIVTNLSRTMASLSLDVFERTVKNGRTIKERLPNHPVARLLKKPNQWQTTVEYFQDATSYLLRFGRFLAYKGQGKTGPIRRLVPLNPVAVEIRQDEQYNVTYRVTQKDGTQPPDYPFWQMHYVRGPARDSVRGDSPVWDCREAIACEIAAQRFGASFFGGGAMPGLILKFAENFAGFKTDEEKLAFIRDFQDKYSGHGRFTAALLPKGVEMGEQLGIEPEKAQFVDTRKLLRNVICGAWGVPPYVGGDVDRQTFNNAQQHTINKSVEVVVPICRLFESAMERDLFTDDDRAADRIVRFNVDAGLRGDFKTRQDGLKIMRESGVINPNEWRNLEGMNPRDDAGGEEYWDEGPSGQGGKNSGDTGDNNGTT
jgi:HK97 family phage portal protein